MLVVDPMATLGYSLGSDSQQIVMEVIYDVMIYRCYQYVLYRGLRFIYVLCIHIIRMIMMMTAFIPLI